jgi:hypothetical protein
VHLNLSLFNLFQLLFTVMLSFAVLQQLDAIIFTLGDFLLGGLGCTLSPGQAPPSLDIWETGKVV